MAIQHLQSSTANKRPTPGAMAAGQIAVNTAGASPGLFFKDASGNLVKVGPVHIGTTAPNASPASGGQTGNTVGEQWLDTTGGTYVLKVWDGTAWRSQAVSGFVSLTGDTMTGALGVIAGTAAAPGLFVSGDTNTGVFSPAADELALSTGGTGRLFINGDGRILAGTSTALTNAYSIGTALTPALQIEGNTGNGAAVSITRHSSAAANLLLQRGVSGTPVASGDAVGQVNFNGYDGANYFNAALVRGIVDSTPGTGSMPGRLSFQTTPSGSTTPVERLRIDSAGQIQAAALGTAAAPVVTFVGDTNTGIFSPSADAVAVTTGGTERLRVNSAGNIVTTGTFVDPAITGTILEDIFTITDGAAFEVDPGNGSVQLITLGASRTPKATNFAAGESVTLMVNDGTAYTLTWTDSTWGTGGVIWTGGSAPTLATTGYTVIQFWKVGSQVYGALVGSVA